jgi:hypothetical protein
VELALGHAVDELVREDELEHAYAVLGGVVDRLRRLRHRLVQSLCEPPKDLGLDLRVRDAREEGLDIRRLLDGCEHRVAHVARQR